MKKLLRPKFSIPFVTGIIVISVLFGVAYSNWIAPVAENYYQKIKIFTTVLQTIQRAYVEETDASKLIDDAIKGMVKNLDPHTTYLSTEEIKDWDQRYRGYSGIGITFDIISDKITIMSVISGGPSDKLGFIPGDRIVRINNENAIGTKQEDVPKKLMGPPGTTVDVSIQRLGLDKLLDYTIVRENVKVESVPVSLMLEEELGYIRIERFSSTTSNELEQALTKLEAQGMDRLILDLRDNNGGYLQMAVEVSEKFLPAKKLIVKTKGRMPSMYREYHSSNGSKHRMLPLIVLINHQSASASEIVSGAVQDWDRGLVAGQTSFGKGLVQTQFPLNDGSVLHITTARYYTPVGRLIQRDYDNISEEEYIREAYNDSLREQKMTELPRFETFAGRTVYGGGGIYPDIWLDDKNENPTRFVLNLYYDRENRYLYKFSEIIEKNHPEIKKMTPMQFGSEFTVSDKEIEGFANYVMKQDVEVKLEDFKAGSKDFKYLLKRDIAYRLWDADGQFYVNFQRDNILQEVKDKFPDAKELLAKSTLLE